MSCTFPSRPEAQSAAWSLSAEPVARYRYEPDIELRWIAWDRPDLLGPSPEDWELFDDWPTVKEALDSNEWGEVFRAAAAFRVAAELREPGIDGELVLVEALTKRTFTVRAAASQLAQVATSRSGSEIEAAMDSARNVETRIDLRRALERIEMQDFTRR